MTDIVERLRQALACDAGCEGRCSECPVSVAVEAANEIERLREAQEEVITVTADLIARREMSCAGCCGPSAKEDEYEGYLNEAKKEIRDAILRERHDVN